MQAAFISVYTHFEVSTKKATMILVCIKRKAVVTVALSLPQKHDIQFWMLHLIRKRDNCKVLREIRSTKGPDTCYTKNSCTNNLSVFSLEK